MRLKDKVCLITGGGKGIGAASAVAFAKEGAIVELADVDADSLQAMVTLITDSGGKAYGTQVDVTDESSVAAWVKAVVERQPGIDVLFNNAGISAVGPLHEVSRQLWDRVLNVNVTGVYVVSKAVVPHMMEQRRGSIINMSSCIAEIGLANRVAYAATKGAVLAMTKSMQVDYAPFHIRVNALLPGTILTPFVEDYLRRDYADSEAALAQLKMRQLAADLGTPEDVAMAAVYLASDESKYMMGAGLAIDGGVTAGKPF